VWFESLSGFGLRPSAAARLHKAVAQSFDRWWGTWIEPELWECGKRVGYGDDLLEQGVPGTGGDLRDPDVLGIPESPGTLIWAKS
jgi:hypothetical protein